MTVCHLWSRSSPSSPATCVGLFCTRSFKYLQNFLKCSVPIAIHVLFEIHHNGRLPATPPTQSPVPKKISQFNILFVSWLLFHCSHQTVADGQWIVFTPGLWRAVFWMRQNSNESLENGIFLKAMLKMHSQGQNYWYPFGESPMAAGTKVYRQWNTHLGVTSMIPDLLDLHSSRESGPQTSYYL